jgi:PEP-CTERM motif-containing protein
MRNGTLYPALLLLVLLIASPAGAAVISVGSFPELNPSPSITIPADTFLVPVQISGAIGLQNWQFDLLFDNTVVEQVDPLDGSSGIYGAEFTPGDPVSLSFILAGFPFNALGLVDDVAGSHPSLLAGASGDGVLSYILFRFLDGQENNDPAFSIADGVTQEAVPQPGTLVLLAFGVAILSLRRRRGWVWLG